MEREFYLHKNAGNQKGNRPSTLVLIVNYKIIMKCANILKNTINTQAQKRYRQKYSMIQSTAKTRTTVLLTIL